MILEVELTDEESETDNPPIPKLCPVEYKISKDKNIFNKISQIEDPHQHNLNNFENCVKLKGLCKFKLDIQHKLQVSKRSLKILKENGQYVPRINKIKKTISNQKLSHPIKQDVKEEQPIKSKPMLNGFGKPTPINGGIFDFKPP